MYYDIVTYYDKTGKEINERIKFGYTLAIYMRDNMKAITLFENWLHGTWDHEHILFSIDVKSYNLKRLNPTKYLSIVRTYPDGSMKEITDHEKLFKTFAELNKMSIPDNLKELFINKTNEAIEWAREVLNV